ncbi:MAG: ribbon-helix-helix domain-containing protein [Hyphomicrobiales bacterium]|nr:ribbon-helix-helix domain-containing protein [Hyphomicrobiales bacterium]MBV8825843.1 ribbon-helix-helix domain-containing protein [Hyphomicrobiales bacterium]
MTSCVLKRSVVIGGRKTSVSLEDDFWTGLEEIAASRQSRRTALVAEISASPQVNLSSAIRLFVLAYYRERSQRNAPSKLQNIESAGMTPLS